MRSDWEEIERHNQPLLSPREIFGAIVIVGLIAMLIGASRPAVATRETIVAQERDVQGAGSPSDMTIVPGIPTEITLPHSSPNRDRAGQGSYVRFYECVVAGQRVLSDNPCGVDAKARTLVVPQPDPAEVARLLQQQQHQQARQLEASRSRRYAAEHRIDECWRGILWRRNAGKPGCLRQCRSADRASQCADASRVRLGGRRVVPLEMACPEDAASRIAMWAVIDNE